MAFAPLVVDSSQYNFTANSSSVTFDGAFYAAQKVLPGLTTDTPVYAVFFSGLDKYYVQVKYTHNGDVSEPSNPQRENIADLCHSTKSKRSQVATQWPAHRFSLLPAKST